MKLKIETAYPHCVGNACISIHHDANFYIQECPNPERCKRRTDTPDKEVDFLVENNNQKEIGLVAIDKCLYDGTGPSRCDCAVFDEHIIAFIEFKLGKGKNRTDRLKEAREQLAQTIERFQAHSIIDSSNLIRAYAHVGFHQTKPAHNATLQASIVYLTEQFSDLNIEFYADNKTSFA